MTSTARRRILSRRQLEARVRIARDDAVRWAETADDVSTIGTYLDAFTVAWQLSGSRNGPRPADYLVLLRQWEVPGIQAPTDLDAPTAELWSRSVTVSLLRVLRRRGHMT